MAEVRACAYILVIFVSFRIVTGKPFFGDLWCDLFCEDDDLTTPTSSDDYSDFFCDGCAPSRPPVPPVPLVPAPTQLTPFGRPGDMSIMIPPSNGMNLTMGLNNGQWVMNMVPWPSAAGPQAVQPGPAPAGAAPAPAGATPAPAGATPAPAGATPAPAGATPAPAGATPAPAAAATPAATTVAPTTAAAGK